MTSDSQCWPRGDPFPYITSLRAVQLLSTSPPFRVTKLPGVYFSLERGRTLSIFLFSLSFSFFLSSFFCLLFLFLCLLHFPLSPSIFLPSFICLSSLFFSPYSKATQTSNISGDICPEYWPRDLDHRLWPFRHVLVVGGIMGLGLLQLV